MYDRGFALYLLLIAAPQRSASNLTLTTNAQGDENVLEFRSHGENGPRYERPSLRRLSKPR